MWRNNFWAWVERYGAYVVGPLLLVAGWVVNRYVEPHHQTHFVEESVIALWVAGILTITVDPFIKRMARREATTDIFHHMLGFSLPPIIRERLHEIVSDTTFYRENTIQHIVMKENDATVTFDVEMEFEVVNPTPHDLCWEPLLQFEKGENAELKTVTCFEQPSCGRAAKLSPIKNGLGSVEYKGEAVRIPGKSGKRRFKYEYSIEYPTSLGFWYPNFQLPTIGFSLTIKHPDSFHVKATPASYEAAGEWRYENKLWMQNEHIDIVWEKST